MKNMIIVCAAILASLSIFASETPLINVPNSSNFALNLDYLKAGNIQYFAAALSGDQFAKLPAEIVALDTDKFYKNKDNYLFIYKTTYTIPVKPNKIFDLNLYENREYILAVHPRLTNLEFPDRSNLLLQTHTVPGPNIAHIPIEQTVFSLQYAELNMAGPQRNSFESDLSKALHNLSEPGLMAPRIMASKTINSNQSMFIGGMTVTSYHPYGDETLVVKYKLAALRPTWPVLMALRLGAAKIFLDAEQEDARQSVIASRRYLRAHQF